MRILGYLYIVCLLATPCFADVIQKNDDGTFVVSVENKTLADLQNAVDILNTKVSQDQQVLDADQTALDEAQKNLDIAVNVNAGATVNEAKQAVSSGVVFSKPTIDCGIYGCN